MLYNFIQILMVIAAVSAIGTLLNINYRMPIENTMVWGTISAICCVIAFALTTVWAGGWVG